MPCLLTSSMSPPVRARQMRAALKVFFVVWLRRATRMLVFTLLLVCMWRPVAAISGAPIERKAIGSFLGSALPGIDPDTALIDSGLIDRTPLDSQRDVESKLICPSRPDRSTVYRRIGSADAKVRMPPLAHNVVDAKALSLVGQWIADLPSVGPHPPGWKSCDVGAVGNQGEDVWVAGSFTVNGSGEDIWDRADAFRFVYTNLRGDGIVVAHLASFSAGDGWGKAGLMIRQDLSPMSPNAFVLISQSNGSAFQERDTPGTTTRGDRGPACRAPGWLKLERRGSIMAGYVSQDGKDWTKVGENSLQLHRDALVGLAVTAHQHGGVAAARFDAVNLGKGPRDWDSVLNGLIGSCSGVLLVAAAITLVRMRRARIVRKANNTMPKVKPRVPELPQTWLGWPAFWLTLAFILSRVGVFLFLAGRGTDLEAHAKYASRIIAGQVPFRDFFPEYPPLALLFTSIPALLDDSLNWYFAIFRGLCCAVDCGLFAVLLWATRGRPGRAFLYLLCSTALGPLLYDRMDIVLGALLLAAVALGLRGKHRWSYLMVGTGIAFKLVPVVIVPALLAAAWKHGWRGLGQAVVLLMLPVILSFDGTYLLGARQFAGLLDYHLARGIQLESTPAVAEILAIQAGVEGTVSSEFGSVNLHTRYEPQILRATSLMLWGMVLASALLAAMRPTDAESMAGLLAALLCGSLLFSKVLSPQYFIFVLPLLAVVPTGGRKGWTVAYWFLVLATYALTAAIFPWNYWALMQLRPDLEVMLIARNLLLAWLTGHLFYNYWKLSSRKPPIDAVRHTTTTGGAEAGEAIEMKVPTVIS